MRKVFLITTLFFACFIGVNAQNFLNIKFSKAAVASGDTANIDITVTNFNQLYGAQFSINWDSLKFKYAGIANKISSNVLPGDLDVGFPPTTTVKNGQATLLWSNANPVSIPNDTRLITLRLKAIGAPCDSTAITMTDKPIKAEYYNENFEAFKPVSVTGQAKINGPGCTGGGGGNTGNELMVIAPSLTAQPGTEVCVPITVKNFKDIEGAQSKLKWDPAVLKIKQPIPPLKYDALPNNSFNTAGLGVGELSFVWVAGTSGAVTIADGQRLMEVCFDVIGAAGTMSQIDIVDKDENFETEYVNGQSASVPFINTDGKVTITNVTSPTLKLTIADVTAVQNDSIDVSFNVDNYIDVKSAQFAVTWDANVLQFGRRYMDAVPNGADGALVNAGRYNYNYLATGSSSTTITNGSLLFKLRFKVAPCQNGATAPLFTTVSVADQPNFLIEFVDKNVNKLNYTVDQGSVTAPCGVVVVPTCNIVSSTNVSCNGLANGSITVEVTNASGCQCAWQKNGTAFGNPIPTPNCNLTNIGPGVYTLVITCDGAQKCSSSVTITEPQVININGSITNVDCNSLGAINLTVTGGVGTNYTYLWSPNNATTKDLTNLTANSYTVTVTDESKCTATKSFTVIQLPSTELKVVPQVINVKCFGTATGSIKLNPEGGCKPYDFTWQNDATNKTDTRSNLAVGTYGVTVTDASTPSKSVALQINVTGPSTDITIPGIVTNSKGTDGAIDVSVTGGTSPYTYKWEDGPTTDDRTGLAPNTYTLVVTDANGCTKSTSFTVVIDSIGPNPTLGDIKVTSESTNAGYGVACVNECNGVIGGIASGGTPPYTIVLSGQASKTITQAAAGPYSFTGLCSGTYKVKMTDSKNVSSTEANLNVTQPTAITVSREINCANGVIPTGSIALTVSGGAGGYTYKWSNNKITKDIENLSVGSYAVVVADANGCQIVLTNLRVTDCNNAGENCYEEFTNIITPNGDGSNEFFEISCAASVENDLFVYDRWGNLVYSQKNYDNLWNGVNSSGSELPENAYLWVLVVKDNGTTLSTYKGAVTILRAE